MRELCAWKNMILADQTHICTFLKELDHQQRKVLETDIKRVHMVKLQKMIDTSDLIAETKKPYPITAEFVDGFEHSSNELIHKYFNHGLKLISLGKIGIVILAGGQGTRLGVDHPKGLFNIGLDSNKTLFQLQIETLSRVIYLANEKYQTTNASITCFIMTSESTNQMTIDFLNDNNYFGFNKKDVIVFEQGQLPCVDRISKKVILSEKYKIAFAPTGNGGFFDCLIDDPSIMQIIDQRNLVGLHVYCVDNVLVRAADPAFIGCCDMKGADCGNKVIERKDPNEPLGVFCIVDDSVQVVEYSEMKNIFDCLVEKNDNNVLLYKYGNICNHYFATTFLKDIVSNKWNEKLPVHVALKKVPLVHLNSGEKYLDNVFITLFGFRIKPDIPNGIKFEKFIFDVVPFTNRKNVCLYNVSRNEEFSPLKNATGNDSPETCLFDLLKFHYKLKNPDVGSIPDDIQELKLHEISPLDFYYNN